MRACRRRSVCAPLSPDSHTLSRTSHLHPSRIQPLTSPHLFLSHADSLLPPRPRPPASLPPTCSPAVPSTHPLAPPQKTFTRYWDFSIPSAEVKPTSLSKYNTALQLALVGLTTVQPLLPFELGMAMQAFQWLVGGTTVLSGVSYLRGAGVKYVK